MLFYFTATGNSRYAAEILQKALGPAAGELYDISRCEKQSHHSFPLAEGEKLGFVYPVYFFAPPDIVTRFAARLRVEGATKANTFSVATCGSTTGGTGKRLAKALAGHNIPLGQWFSVRMPKNYLLMYDMLPPAEQTQRLNDAEHSLAAMAATIKKSTPGDYDSLKGPLPAITTPFAKLAFSRSTKKFHALDTCTGCGLCAKICPASAIEMQNGRPVWMKPTCEKCTACLHRCPVAAVQHGPKTQARGRYKNPRVEWSAP